MRVIIEKEPFSLELAEEIRPLGQKCWDESTIVKQATCAYYGERDFVIEPAVDVYEQLASQGLVLLVTLRCDGVLKGYVIGFIYKSWHHKKIKCGIADSIYIEPEHRSYTAVVVEKFEKALREIDVEIIGWPTHIDGPTYEVLKALGYVGDDIVMEKRLCASRLQ